MNSNSVKQERYDEAEIQELAAKMVEASRAKMPTPVRPQVAPGQMSIFSFLTSPNKKAKTDPLPTTSGTDPPVCAVDDDSVRGRFGWTTLGKVHIPYLFRAGEKYCSVRMVEMKLLNKYLNFLHQDIYNCTCIRSYYITDAECRLLNEINCRHCDYQFGRDHFTGRDLIVRLSDAQEFYNFLDSCYNKLVSGNLSPHDRCGFIRINKESVVPYTIYNNQKYVPLFYFEGETDNLKLKADKLEGWDLSYLKFCCKVQGIRNELFAHDSCSVISLCDIKNYFPPGTIFEDYWPKKTLDSQLLINGKAQTQMVQWTRQPAAPPAHTSPKPAQPKTIVANIQNVQALYPGYGLSAGQGAYGPSRAATATAVRASYPPAAGASRQMRPTSYYGPHQLPPPPLIRASQQQSIQAYTTAPTTVGSANYMMMPENNLSPTGYRSPIAQAAKYNPPPLIPARHLNGGLRFDSPYGLDAVDLSSPPTNNQAAHQQLINQQPAHQQSARTPTDDHSGVTSGRVTLNSLQKKLTPLPDPPTSGSHIPYKIQKALVQGKMIPCINMKPYVYSDLLVTLPDLVSNFFNNMPVQSCHQVMTVLGIELYKGNNSQMRVLLENGKCQSLNEVVPLVQVRNVIEYMPQLKYMIGGILGSNDLAAKRQRTS